MTKVAMLFKALAKLFECCFADDATVRDLKGSLYPIQSMLERALCVIGKKASINACS